MTWATQLWRPRCPTICPLQARDPGKLVSVIQSKSKRLRTELQCPRAGENDHPAQEEREEVDVPSPLCSV